MINLLVSFKLFSYKDLEKLSNLNDDQLDCITTVICKSVIESNDENLLENEILKLSFFKANKKALIEKHAQLAKKE